MPQDNAPRRTRGFTLIELLVVCAIIVIITGLLLTRQSKLDSSTLLRSLGYSVALSVRQAQIFGTSIVSTQVGGAPVFPPGYGLHFSSANPGSYILFADIAGASGKGNGVYDVGEEVQTFTLNKGYAIREFCAMQGTIKYCSGSDTTGTSITKLDIIFRHPNPDACFSTDTVSNDCVPGASSQFSSAYIQIQSTDGTTRSVVVTASGQISVQPPNTLP